MTEAGIFWLTAGILFIILAPVVMWATDRVAYAIANEDVARNLIIDKAILQGRVRNLKRRLRRKRRPRKVRTDTRHLEKVR